MPVVIKSRYLLLFFVLQLVLFQFVLSQLRSDGKTCATPSSKEGVCVPIEKCIVLKEIMNKTKLSEEERALMLLSQCGTNEPRVCCQISNRDMTFRAPQTHEREEDFEFRSGNANGELTCGEQNYLDDKIIGVLAGLDEFPWMALLKYRTEQGEGYGCGGAIIDTQFILTAAHCLVGKFGAPVEVTLGEYDINTPIDCVKLYGYEDCALPVQNINVKEAIAHPDYVKGAPDKLHDVALLKLETPIKYNDFVLPICLPSVQVQNRVLKPEVIMQVAGWGRTKNRPASNVKRKARVPIVDRASCSEKRLIKIGDSQICAGGGKEDSCTGDSGGPLMARHVEGNDQRWYVSGIVSFGPKQCASTGIPAVYTNVISYIDWIKATMRSH